MKRETKKTQRETTGARNGKTEEQLLSCVADK